ncbi:hypothetical protein BDW22DRAFT_1484572 [Trametopsis cervina]|nr:hypothetical protein BDW22DRAFT_1484572 [Trametopsis cervina]
MHLQCLTRHLSTQPPISAVHRGAAYERWCMRVLESCLSMSLSQVGGRADGGVDLQGWWWLPTGRQRPKDPSNVKRIRVLAQCKAEKKKISPKYVREMEGVLHQFTAASNPTLPDTQATSPDANYFSTVGLFISASPFTKLTLLRAQSSSLPLALLHLPEQPMDEGKPEADHNAIGSILFNSALGSTSGVLKGEFEARWEYSTKPEGGGRPVIWWRGKRMASRAVKMQDASGT